ncbi:MAG: PAS domain-containing sensor histidine kinase, partial [Lachnospiraceae bacterium]|nr:PAS domain-containing sensor histidine kinase [Lachnospiraceae bacterium]
MMNYTEEEKKNLPYYDALDFVYAEDRAVTRSTMMNKARMDQPVLLEYRKRREDGEILWIRLRGKVIGEEDGCKILQCVLMDCTEEKIAEAELIKKESLAVSELEKARRVFKEEMQYQEATQSDKLLVKVRSNITKNVVESYIARDDIGISADNMPYDLGSENLAMTGYTKKQQDEIRHLLDAKRVLSAYAQGDYQYSVDYQRKTHKGKVIWVNTTVKTYADLETGDIKSFMYSYDIDEEMTLKIMIEKMMALDYEVLAVYWPDGHYTHVIHAKAGDIKYENEDLPENNLLPQLISQIIPGERDKAKEAMSVEKIYKELEKNPVYVCSFTTEAEGRRYRKKWQYTFMDESRRAVIIMGSDVTNLFQQQEKAKEELQHALLLSRQANEARTNFLSRVSHDMRTPLNAILGFSEFSQKETNLEILHDYIGKIQESGQYLLNLINDTLDINRIQSDSIKLIPTYVKSRKLLEQILHSIEINAEKKGVNFQTQMKGFRDVYLYVDGMR